jgi:hypothetical protein
LQARRAALLCLLLAQILFVWGGMGLAGETWLRLPFCSVSSTGIVTGFLVALWLLASFSPIVGILAIWHERLWTAYLALVALTFVVFWLTQFLLEIDVTFCDPL